MRRDAGRPTGIIIGRLFRSLDRPALLSPLREGTVRDKVSALKRRRIGPTGWTLHRLRHAHATAVLSAGPRNGAFHAVFATLKCKPRSTSTAGSARTKRFALRRTGGTTPTAGRPPSMHPDPIPLQPASSAGIGASAGGWCWPPVVKVIPPTVRPVAVAIGGLGLVVWLLVK